MIEVLICLKDIDYSIKLNKYLEDKKEYSVWNIVNKEHMINLLNNEIVMTNDIKIIITDADNKDLLNSTINIVDYYIVYVTETLSFSCEEENSFKIFKTINFSNFDIIIKMLNNNSTMAEKIDIEYNKARKKYSLLFNKLNKELSFTYNQSSELLDDKKYIVIVGNKGTGKTYLSKLLTYANSYILLDEDTINIDAIMFGDVSNNKYLIHDMASKPIYIIIDNFDKLPEKTQIRIISAIKYKIYNKLNDNRQYKVKAKFILNCTELPKLIHRFDINNIVWLPEINDYHYMNKISIVYNVIGKKNKIGIQKQAIDYITNYDYSKYGIELLEDIGRYIKKKLGDSETIKVEHLPSWLTSKVPYEKFGILELREIADNGIFELKEVEKLVIKGAYKKCFFIKEETAKLLGISVGTLNNKIKSYNINMENLIDG